MPGELAKHAVSEGTKAVTKFSSSWNKNKLLNINIILSDLFISLIKVKNI